MIDNEQLTSVLNSLATIDQDRFNKLTSIKGLWESGILNENKMQNALDEQIAFVEEYYFPSVQQEFVLAGIAITETDLQGFEVIDEGDRYRIIGKQTVLIPKDTDINIFNEIKLTL